MNLCYAMIYIVTRKLSWQEFSNSINKASKLRKYNLMLKLWLKKWLIYAVLNFQQSLQNRVPRVQVLLPLPSKNGLNTAFKPFFDIFLCTEHGLIFRCWHSFQASKCSTSANNSNVSVCYIIKIASKIITSTTVLSCQLHYIVKNIEWPINLGFEKN